MIDERVVIDRPCFCAIHLPTISYCLQLSKMSAVTFSDMPQEILDQIVDHGAADKTSMENCALVFHSLRPRAQKHLYDKITIVTTQRILQLMKIIRGNPFISNYLATVVVSSRQFIPIHGVNTALVSLFLPSRAD